MKFSAGGPLLEFREPAEPGAHFQMKPDVVVQSVNSNGDCWTSRYLPADVTSGSGERLPGAFPIAAASVAALSRTRATRQ